MGNDKDVGFFALANITFPDFFALVAASSSLFIPIIAFLGFSTSIATFFGLLISGFVTSSLTSTMDAYIPVCSSFCFFFVWLSPFFFSAHHTIPTSLSLMRIFRSTLLSLKDDYAI